MFCGELKLLINDPLGELVVSSTVLPGDCAVVGPTKLIVAFGVLNTPEPPNRFWVGVPNRLAGLPPNNTLAGLPPNKFPAGEANRDCELLFASLD